MWTLTSCAADGGKETYGIQKGETVINDISTDRAEIEEFVEQLNRCDASEIHAYELVEDFLGK